VGQGIVVVVAIRIVQTVSPIAVAGMTVNAVRKSVLQVGNVVRMKEAEVEVEAEVVTRVAGMTIAEVNVAKNAPLVKAW